MLRKTQNLVRLKQHHQCAPPQLPVPGPISLPSVMGGGCARLGASCAGGRAHTRTPHAALRAEWVMCARCWVVDAATKGMEDSDGCSSDCVGAVRWVVYAAHMDFDPATVRSRAGMGALTCMGGGGREGKGDGSEWRKQGKRNVVFPHQL